jgi:hypothetical protein
MNTIKRFLGLLWILAGPVAMVYLIMTAAAEISKKPAMETKIQWTVFILVFLPIAAGLVLFGVYALRGEYDEVRAGT